MPHLLVGYLYLAIIIGPSDSNISKSKFITCPLHRYFVVLWTHTKLIYILGISLLSQVYLVLLIYNYSDS